MIDPAIATTENEKFIAHHFNLTLERMKSEMVDSLPACDNPSGMAAANAQFRFRLVTQCYLRRLHYLARKFSEALNCEDVLMSLIMARTLLETQAHLHHLLFSLIEALEKKNFGKAHKFLTKHTLGRKDGHAAHTDIKPVHIAESLKTFDKTYEGNSNDHAYYSEYLHPNSSGNVQLFSDYDEKTKHFVLFDEPKKQFSRGFTTACSFCSIGEDLEKFSRIEDLIDKHWQPPETPQELH